MAKNIKSNQAFFHDYLGEKIGEEFIFKMITPNMLLEMAGKMKSKTSCGPDGISTKLLKIILPQILTPLCYLFNLSLQSGYIPIQLKTAKVIPVFKSGDKNSYTNYRPISLLNSLSKILEKIVAKQML